MADNERSQRERMLAGDLYIADDPELAAESHRAMELAARYNAVPSTDTAARRSILAELLGSVGPTHRRPGASGRASSQAARSRWKKAR